MTSMEAVIGTMIFIVLFCVISDLIVLSNRYATLADTGKELARTISVQGGALNDKPGGYPANYYNITELASMTSENMTAAGFKSDEWAVGIKYNRIYNSTTETSEPSDVEQIIIAANDAGVIESQQTMKIDYLSNFTLYVKAKYKWPFLSAVLPQRTTVMKVTMPGTSEWKYNYDKWESENAGG